MKPIRTFRMWLWLPLAIFGLYSVSILLSAGFQHRSINIELEKNSRAEVSQMLANSGRRTESLLRQDQRDLVAEEVAVAGVNVHIDSFVLLDEQGRVLEATRLEWRGHLAVEKLPRFEPARFVRVQKTRQQMIYFSTDGNHLQGYQPVTLSPAEGEVRSSRIGALVISYDITADKQNIWRELLRQRLLIWSVTLGMTLVLLWVLRLRLLRPLKILTESVRRFGAGEPGDEVQITGNGELAELASAWNKMRAQLTATLVQLEDSRENLQVTLYSIGDAVIATDAEGRVTRMNGVAQELTGWNPDDAVGRPLNEVFNIIQARTRRPAENPVQRVLSTGMTVGLANHTVLVARDGREFQIADTAAPIRSHDGQLIGVVLVFRDVTEEYSLRENLQIAATAFDAQEGIMVTDANNVILRVNTAFNRITGYTDEEVIGRTPQILKSGRHDAQFYEGMWSSLMRDHYWQGEIWNRRKSGELFPEWLTITGVVGEDGQIINYVAAFSDITQYKVAEEQIHQLAFYDPLTGLPNRRLLYDRLQQALVASVRNNCYGAILFIDLDNFKVINDTRGHDVGDLLLIEVAKRLQGCVRGEDTVARLGGDEFVIMLDCLSDDQEQAIPWVEAVGHKILQVFAPTFSIGGYAHHTSPSIGITLFRDHEIKVDELLKRADAAMYQAKQAGRNTLRFFDPAMQTALEARLALEADMRRALPEDEFKLYFQSQVDASGRLIGAEVLLRWQHPTRGLVPPGQFIPLAEETGLIAPLGQWVLEAACRQLKLWESDPCTRDLQLAVNVSARQFRQGTFVDEVSQALLMSGINPNRLKLELTESLVLENVEDTIAKMQKLKAIGVSFSMDDFGTGQSSLTYLKKLPLDQLKIDQSFVRDITKDPDDAVIVRTIIAMAKNLKLDVIAEGVETEEQRRFLEQCGCPAYQGYLFGRPEPIQAFEAAIRV